MTVAYLSLAQRKVQAQLAALADHAGLQQALDGRADVLAAVVARGALVGRMARLLHAFLTEEVLLHGAAGKRGFYRAGEQPPRTELLVRALVSEYHALAWRSAGSPGQR